MIVCDEAESGDQLATRAGLVQNGEFAGRWIDGKRLVGGVRALVAVVIQVVERCPSAIKKERERSVAVLALYDVRGRRILNGPIGCNGVCVDVDAILV